MRAIKDLTATTRSASDKRADKKAPSRKAKPEPITTWEGEGGALEPDSGSLTEPGRRNQPKLRPSSRR